MRLLALSLIMTMIATPQLAKAARGTAIPITCTGPVATAGRAIAKSNSLKLGQNPKACFGKMQIYDGPDRQFVVAVPASDCPKGRRLDVYGQSRAGPWYSYFETPICGSALSIGPKNPWGDWMLTVDGKHYDSRGAYYVAVTY